MKSNVIIAVFVLTVSVGLFAQSEGDSQSAGVLTAQQKLKEISVSKMEDAGFWYGIFQADNGIIGVRSLSGSSIDKKPIPDEETNGIAEPDEKVLGAKVTFFRRGVVEFSLKRIRPLPIDGITKTISVWVAGRNSNHTMDLLVSDHFGHDAVIPMGKLNFSGWKKMTVTIPPNIIQSDYHYINRRGLSIVGFTVKCDIDETYGRYFIYIDDIRAVTDLFSEESRDTDDMMDSW